MLTKQQTIELDTIKWLLANPGKTMVIASPTLLQSETTAERVKQLVLESTGRTVHVKPATIDGKSTKASDFVLTDRNK